MPRFDAGYVPRSAMAIYAHPDDIEFTVAGTVAKWARAGCEVTFVLITSGNAGSVASGAASRTAWPCSVAVIAGSRVIAR